MVGPVQTWNLREIETPGGSLSPVVVDSREGVARAVLVRLEPGQELGDHQVKEHAFVVVVEGDVEVAASGGRPVRAAAGTLFAFDPDERHSIAASTGARLLLLLAPWPGEGHYRGEERELV